MLNLLRVSSNETITHDRSMDLNMFAVFNAEERDIDAWQDLFQSTDTRFRFLKIQKPEGSALAIMEFIWDT